ncbi:MAG: ABC transporter ATP-binding protein [Desulfobacteraceae bacterium]|nr:MAG: ABC transporter ATP-binding protein [Desulfobacteraceae bacterium]
MTETILEIQNLSCGYGEKTILRDISLNVITGEILSIIGPNGSGKTTLLKSVTHIIQPAKGKILFQGKEIQSIPRNEFARKVAVVGQAVEPARMTVKEYVLLGRLPYFRRYQFMETGNDRRLAQHYMELTHTDSLQNQLMTEISGGERQLASIARALVQEPTLLLLDEPTSHLDITHQAQILSLIRRLNQDLRLTVLMVVHDLNLASEYSDRLILLNKQNGRIYRTGTPEEVLTEPAIREIYNTPVLIEKNPLSGKPCIFLSPENCHKRELI